MGGAEGDKGGYLSKHSVWPWEKPKERGLLGGVLGQNSVGNWEQRNPFLWLDCCCVTQEFVSPS